MTKCEANVKLVTTLYGIAKPYLDIEDRTTAPRDLKAEAKVASYNLLAMMLLWITPNPIEQNW